MATPGASHAYLTAILWPPGAGRSDRARLVADALDVDEPTARLMTAGDAPTIVGYFERAASIRAAARLRAAGGEAFTASLAEIESLGATVKIKDMRLENGQLAVDVWRGEPRVIDPGTIQVLIRARLSESYSVDAIPSGPGRNRGTILRSTPAAAMVGWAWGGAYGMAVGVWAANSFGDTGMRERRTVSSEKLDIHTNDGTVYQVDGDKFGFRILGDMRGHSDNVNIDRMCELLAHLAPDEIVDPYFSLWRPPVGYGRLRLPLMKTNNDDPAFAFYSRWAALMYRQLLAQGS